MIIRDKDTGYEVLFYPQEKEPFPFVPWTIEAYVNTLKMYGKDTPKQYISAEGKPIDSLSCVGTFVETAYNKFGVFFGKRNNTDLYRGQNKDYPLFKPTAKRYDSSKEDRVRYCIDYLRKQTFLDLFKTSPYYERCRMFKISGAAFEFDFEAISQHYEFISNYIDITTNINIALFFAYTYRDDNGQHHLIQKFDDYEPTIYHADLVDIYEKYRHKLKMIGFQALMRPLAQKAMAMDVTSEEDYKKAFKKISLPKDPILAKGIYDSLLGGALIFPPSDKMAQCANEVRRCNSINEKYWEQYLNEVDTEHQISKEDLISAGITFDGKEWHLSDFIKYEMNRELDDDILIFLNNYIDVQTVMRMAG